MSATVAAALKKAAVYILGDEKKRGKLFVLIGSIVVGFIGLMCLPVAVLSSMGSMEGNNEVQEMPDDEFTWKESYEFKEKDLPDGKYAFTYEVTDITGKSTMSDVAFLNLKNGEIKPEL